MTDALEAVRHHVAATHALLERLDAPGAGTSGTGGQPSRMGIQVDAAELAKLAELADRLALTPTLTLKLALRALEIEMSKTQRCGPGRLVGKKRGLLLEGKR